MRNLIKLLIVLIIGVFFTACGSSNNDNSETVNSEKTYLIEYYKLTNRGLSLSESFWHYYKNENSNIINIIALDNLNYKYGYKYKVKAKEVSNSEYTTLMVSKLIEKTFTPLPFNTTHQLKYFKAEHLQDNEYKILHDLVVKIEDNNIKTKFDDIITRSDALDFQNDNNETFKLYFEFDSNDLNETINFVKLKNIIEQ